MHLRHLSIFILPVGIRLSSAFPRPWAQIVSNSYNDEKLNSPSLALIPRHQDQGPDSPVEIHKREVWNSHPYGGFRVCEFDSAEREIPESCRDWVTSFGICNDILNSIPRPTFKTSVQSFRFFNCFFYFNTPTCTNGSPANTLNVTSEARSYFLPELFKDLHTVKVYCQPQDFDRWVWPQGNEYAIAPPNSHLPSPASPPPSENPPPPAGSSQPDAPATPASPESPPPPENVPPPAAESESPPPAGSSQPAPPKPTRTTRKTVPAATVLSASSIPEEPKPSPIGFVLNEDRSQSPLTF